MLLVPGGGRCAVTKGGRNRSDASCLWGYQHVVSFRSLKKIREGVELLLVRGPVAIGQGERFWQEMLWRFRSLLNGGSLVHSQGDLVTKIVFLRGTEGIGELRMRGGIGRLRALHWGQLSQIDLDVAQ